MSLVLAHEAARRRRRRPCRSRRARCRPSRQALAGPARAAAPPPRTARTTRPRSSARRPCRAVRPASRCPERPARAARRRRPGAAGRCPDRTAASNEVSSSTGHHAVDQQPHQGGSQDGDDDRDGGALHAPSRVAADRPRAMLRVACGGSSVGRASASQAEGREFEPRPPLSSFPTPRRAKALVAG